MNSYQAAVETHGSQLAAAIALGMSRSTLQRRLKDVSVGKPPPRKYRTKTTAPVLPKFSKTTIEPGVLVQRKLEDFRRYSAARRLQDWYPVKLPDRRPIGVLWFGDPHVDDNGCNWELLNRHIEACKNTDGLYGANIGDVTNNWSGRLAALFAKQDTSQASARVLAEWFLRDSGVDWLLHIIGNHAAWGDGIDILQRMNAKTIPMLDWKAAFRLTFPAGKNGGAREIKVVAAHDFPGHSMWNKTHGPARAAQMGGELADLYVCGHKHTWGMQQFETADGRCPLSLRVRGYKWHDEYAHRLGFSSDNGGAAILTIIDPDAEPGGRILPYVDVEAGARVLTALRGASR